MIVKALQISNETTRQDSGFWIRLNSQTTRMVKRLIVMQLLVGVRIQCWSCGDMKVIGLSISENEMVNRKTTTNFLKQMRWEPPVGAG